VENAFDIMKVRSDDSLTWVESAEELSAAKFRVCELLASSPGEYIVFNQRTKKLVSHFSALPALQPRGLVEFNEDRFEEVPATVPEFDDDGVRDEVGVVA